MKNSDITAQFASCEESGAKFTETSEPISAANRTV